MSAMCRTTADGRHAGAHASRRCCAVPRWARPPDGGRGSRVPHIQSGARAAAGPVAAWPDGAQELRRGRQEPASRASCRRRSVAAPRGRRRPPRAHRAATTVAAAAVRAAAAPRRRPFCAQRHSGKGPAEGSPAGRAARCGVGRCASRRWVIWRGAFPELRLALLPRRFPILTCRLLRGGHHHLYDGGRRPGTRGWRRGAQA